ncbi:MAG: peptidoglycan bridge formation glycyltransferase FemA/FemB family protein, partial [Patescibacteria group bacterium]
VGRRKLGSFAYVPRGPVLKSFERGPAQAILKYLQDFATSEKVDYLRVEPPWEAGPELEELFRDEGYRRAQVVTSQAGGVSLLLDLALSEEELLAQMRKTTRYLLQNTAGLGIEIHKSADPRKMEEFYRLTNVARRWQGFVPHPRRYLQTEFETLAPRGIAEMFWANYRNDILAAAIVFSYGDTVTYVHGASTRSEVPASYHLLWEIIKEAKKDGYRYFDLWGIDSLFKNGFGGYQVNYAGVWDYPLSPKYWTVFGIEKLRRLVRRY